MPDDWPLSSVRYATSRHFETEKDGPMDKPFSGQYLAAHYDTNHKAGYVIINVDPDARGCGVAYVTSPGLLTAAIFECVISVNAAGLISGEGKQSERLEKYHQISNDSGQREFTFTLRPGADSDELVYREKGKEERSISLDPIRAADRATATELSTWKDFREWAIATKARDPDSIFRGVSKTSHDLKTSFHRTGRVDLERFRDLDMPAFTDIAETIGSLRFDGGMDDNGACLGYAQHHGFPTPLLDWTESPYVAAYFALSSWLEESSTSKDAFVRIYSLDGKFANSNRPDSVRMSDVFPRVWIFRPKSKGNQRLVFQQGLFLHSNVVAIEAYLLHWSRLTNYNTLSAVDIPASMARDAIEELGYMGVNHLSLFPGLDGAARFAAFKQFYRPIRN